MQNLGSRSTYVQRYYEPVSLLCLSVRHRYTPDREATVQLHQGSTLENYSWYWRSVSPAKSLLIKPLHSAFPLILPYFQYENQARPISLMTRVSTIPYRNVYTWSTFTYNQETRLLTLLLVYGKPWSYARVTLLKKGELGKSMVYKLFYGFLGIYESSRKMFFINTYIFARAQMNGTSTLY